MTYHYHLAIQDRPLPEWGHFIGAKSCAGGPCGDVDNSGEFDVVLLFGGKMPDVGEHTIDWCLSKFRLPGYCELCQESDGICAGHTKQIYAGQVEQIAYYKKGYQ